MQIHNVPEIVFNRKTITSVYQEKANIDFATLSNNSYISPYNTYILNNNIISKISGISNFDSVCDYTNIYNCTQTTFPVIPSTASYYFDNLNASKTFSFDECNATVTISTNAFIPMYVIDYNNERKVINKVVVTNTIDDLNLFSGNIELEANSIIKNLTYYDCTINNKCSFNKISYQDYCQNLSCKETITVDSFYLSRTLLSSMTNCVIKSLFLTTKLASIYSDFFQNNTVLNFVLSDSILTDPFSNVAYYRNGAFENCNQCSTVDGSTVSFSINLTARNSSSAFKNFTFVSTTDTRTLLSSLLECCFSGCSNLGSVMASNCGTVGNSCFKDCDLNEITFISSNSSRIMSIGNNAFEGVTGKLDFNNFPISYVGERGLYNCTNISYFNTSGFVSLGNSALANCNLTNIAGTNLTFMGDNCLEGNKLSSFSFNDCCNVGKEVLKNNTNLLSLYGRNIFEMNGICKDCSNLTYVNMSNVKTFGTGNFLNCPLNSITFSGIDRVDTDNFNSFSTGAYLNFPNCTFFNANTTTLNYLSVSEVNNTLPSVKSLIINNCNVDLNKYISVQPYLMTVENGIFTAPTCAYNVNVNNLNNNMFKNCTNLYRVIVNDSVKSVNDNCFENCGIYSFSNPVEEIGNSAFRNCTRFTSMEFGLVTKIGDRAFENCGFSSAVLNNNVNFGDRAFANCSALTSFCCNATSFDYNILENATGLEILMIKNCSSIVNLSKNDNLRIFGFGSLDESVYSSYFTNLVTTIKC